jgi:hypothetical protein
MRLFRMETKVNLLKILLFLVSTVSGVTAYSANLQYPVSEIPDKLKQNSHTVYRVYDQSLEVRSEKDASETIHEVITILNKNGEINSYFKVLTNSLTSLRGFRGKLYDANGKQIRSFSVEDLIDRSYIDGESVFSDDRIEFVDPKCQTYPFTVEYTYTLAHKQIFSLPSWMLFNHNISYQNATCSVEVPEGFNLNYKEYNVVSKCVKTTEKKNDIYSWTANDVVAIIPESYADYTRPDFPVVRFATENFNIKGVAGSLKSWREFGKWQTEMIKGKDVLPEITVAKIKDMISACKSDYEKISVLYEYMQRKTRFVSIQIGLGGIEPYDAGTVDKTSYGDCKALSNYMKALLSVAGIKSHYTLIDAGEDEDMIDESFPSNQFNHVIVCVPLEKDTVWLECTNSHFPSGYTGSFTDDRKALIIDGEESKLVHTNTYSAEQNCIQRKYSVTFDDLESGSAKLNTIYKGMAYENILPVYYAENNIIKEKIVQQSISLPSFTLVNFNYKENKDRLPSFEEDINLSFMNYIRKLSESVYLLPLNFMNNTIDIPERVRQRKSDVYVRRSGKDITEIEFNLPVGYKVLGELTPVVIDSKYGKYLQKISISDGKLFFKRTYELYKGVYTAAEYNDFRDFAQQIVTADKIMVQLVKL